MTDLVEMKKEDVARSIMFEAKEGPRAALYLDAEDGKVKFEGDADLAAQKLLEIFQSAIDRYIAEKCEAANGRDVTYVT